MTPLPHNLYPTTLLLVLLLAGGAAVAPLAARQPAERPDIVDAPGASGTRRGMDAERTREALMELLERQPPSVGRVLKLDPSLLRSEDYLGPYPDLRSFLAEHPEVALNAPYYLERVHGVGEGPPSSQGLRMVEELMTAAAVLAGIGVVLGTFVWLVRTVLEQRRWNRLSRIQAEVHTKLMDRFSSNEELLTYVQMPAGRRFLESGPSPLQEVQPTISAPLTRILWSIQIGAVLLVTGLGLLFLSGRAAVEMREFFYVMGCMAAAVGAGFVVSAAAAYMLSRRLGLLDSPVQTGA